MATRQQVYPSHSVMDDHSDDEEDDDEIGMSESEYYQQQQILHQQQQHQQQGGVQDGVEEEYSDSESSTDSLPDPNIDFSLHYALHTFLATVEGQASVVKGDSLLLLDDANSYWWLVRVLKTEDVGYIPAENIETPYERLARLNKHRNVDIAAATQLEKQAGAVQSREKLKGLIAGKSKGVRHDLAGEEEEENANRRVDFAPPTYVEHPGVTWSSDEEESEGEEDHEPDEVEEQELEGAGRSDDVEDRTAQEISHVEMSLPVDRMEPDDGVEWADGAVEESRDQAPVLGKAITPQSNNPFAPRQHESVKQPEITYNTASTSSTSINSLDPAQAGETRRITVTPTVASGPLLPCVIVSQSGRKASGQSINSVASTTSVSSYASANSGRSATPTSPDDGKKIKKARKEETEKKRTSRGVLGGLFSRKKDKDKKGISSSDARSSEESMTSGAIDSTRSTDDGPRSLTPYSPNSAQPVSYGLRLQQQDQALQQSYTSKYLSPNANSPTASDAAAAVAQSAAAMRLSAMTGGRPSSIIVSPNPSAPLLNVIRIFAGDNIKSDASFKTVLLNETTSSSDLIRQAAQRFHLHNAEFYLTVKDVSGEEMELAPNERPLSAFQEAIQRWADDQTDPTRGLTPTVKRSSVGSISSISSNLSTHPAIAKLGMNDFSDDSTVKIYLNRRRVGSIGMSEQGSEFSSYTSNLSTVQEVSSEPDTTSPGSNVTVTPPQPRLNPSLTVNTNGTPSPERFSSPSSRFTIQLVIHPSDLPDGAVFDPSSDSIVPRAHLRERPPPADPRRKLFILPRNATVLEVVEQGLERFGIQGVVEGGDDVEDKVGRSTRVRYSLTVYLSGQERTLPPSSKILEAYPSPPMLRPMERSTPEERRRSRDASQNTGKPSDLLPTDPVFILRRVGSRVSAEEKQISTQRQLNPVPPSTQTDSSNAGKSPQEIIAAQRAASRATQKALISAHANQSQGIDLVLPDKGTLRSSRLMEPDGERVRYSYIDGDGETYDISELLENEWGADGNKSSPAIGQGMLGVQKPGLLRSATGESNYVTAPSTPEPEGVVTKEIGGGDDILRGALQKAANQPDGRLEEKISRVIDLVKSRSDDPAGRMSPTSQPNGRQTPQPRTLFPLPEGRAAEISPRANEYRSSSRQELQQTAQSVNRIVSRHRQQPSIASIMSEVSTSNGNYTNGVGRGFDDDGTSTPTTSSQATPPFHGAIFTRAVSSASPTPRSPVVYKDDFGMKNMMAAIEARARDLKPNRSIEPIVVGGDGDEVGDDQVERMFYGMRVGQGIHPDIQRCFGGLQGRLDSLDREIDELMVGLIGAGASQGGGKTLGKAGE